MEQPWERGRPALDEGETPSFHCSLRASTALPVVNTCKAIRESAY